MGMFELFFRKLKSNLSVHYFYFTDNAAKAADGFGRVVIQIKVSAVAVGAHTCFTFVCGRSNIFGSPRQVRSYLMDPGNFFIFHDDTLGPGKNFIVYYLPHGRHGLKAVITLYSGCPVRTAYTHVGYNLILQNPRVRNLTAFFLGYLCRNYIASPVHSRAETIYQGSNNTWSTLNKHRCGKYYTVCVEHLIQQPFKIILKDTPVTFT